MKKFSWELFEKMPLAGIMRNIPAEDRLIEMYLESGLTNLEITMNSEGAAEIIHKLTGRFGEQMNIGAGTVLTLNDLKIALEAGTQFIVTPVLNEDVIKACVLKNIPVIPGAYTPTEIYKAWKMGASMVKVFPATSLGPKYIKEVLAPLNDLKLFPTGGITIDNCVDFLKAGAKGVGLGNNLFPKDMITNKKWTELKNVFDSFVNKINLFMKSA